MRALLGLLTLLALVFPGDAAARPTRLTLESGRPPQYEMGIELVAILEYDGPPCPAGFPPPLTGTLTLFRDGVPVEGGIRFFSGFYRECNAGRYRAGKDILRSGFEFGSHTFTVAYSGEGDLEPATSDPVVLTVPAPFTGTAPGGGPMAVGLTDPAFGGGFGWFCPAKNAVFTASAPAAPPPPPGWNFPYGFIGLSGSGCYFECGFLCPGGPPARLQQRVLAEFPGEIPPGSVLWAYTPTRDEPTPPWRPLAASFAGRRASAILSAGYAAGVPFAQLDGTLNSTLALAVRPELSAERRVGGLWWGGAGETGWGLHLAQNGDRLLGMLYVYDGDGRPAWIALDGGSWDPTRSVYTTDLRRAGTSVVGSARLSFTGEDVGALDYEIGGARGSKAILRQRFGSAAASGAYEGAWWVGAADPARGLSVSEQGAALFAVWHTRDGAGDPLWYVLPSGAWLSTDTFSGTLYRTRSSPWVAASYDEARLVATPVGTMSLTFQADTGRMAYTVDGRSGVEEIRRRPF